MTAELIWKVRSNGVAHKTGWGYRFEMPTVDRDTWFEKKWSAVFLELPSAGKYSTVRVSVGTHAFWLGKTPQLNSVEIGNWLLKEKLAPWTKGAPPRVKVMVKGDGHFRVVGTLAPLGRGWQVRWSGRRS